MPVVVVVLQGQNFLSSWIVSPPRVIKRFVVRKSLRFRFRFRCLTTCSSSPVRTASALWEPLLMPCSRWKNTEVQCRGSSPNVQHSVIIPGSDESRFPELAYDRLQLNDGELLKGIKHRSFGRYVAREAMIDEEYWTAAWLRAEAYGEALPYMRHVNSLKRKYAEQEFYGLKQRCSCRNGNLFKCICIITVKKEETNVRRTVLNSVVGTLDISIRQFMQGESIPGLSQGNTLVSVPYKACHGHDYAYIANVCVSKFARRQGIATNMVQLAMDIANSEGIMQLFVQVNVDNRHAHDLYKKVGFKIVEAGSCLSSDNRKPLMLMEL
ncbi:Acyl-CoA N-acyltransferases (NAT) superfamily protein [Zostera marina]|uniref:Acyl-CoA N-acyltransferases (NAT) superfamily protein n=1 Tax=Zostera marina TaxID=29655 RepID=A0A0K9PP65_ZOSMR|nr:Acyl-CoA N-acyltransferases (NAT) superfamily protein [Zostera marina]